MRGVRVVRCSLLKYMDPSVSDTTKKQKTSHDPKKQKTPVRDPTALLFNNSYLRVCDHDPT